jgi:hypothetical protein
MAKRGRPRLLRQENPYITYARRFRPGATKHWFDHFADLGTPGSSQYRARINERACELIFRMKVPLLRRVIESILVFDHGFSPAEVTKALAELQNRIYKGKLIGQQAERLYNEPRSNPSHVYWCGERPTLDQIDFLKDKYRNREILLTESLGNAGERYVRALIKASNCFESVTQENQIGSVFDAEGKNKLDLMAMSKRSGIRYGISVKNEREFLRPDSVSLNDVLKKCYKHSLAGLAKPWLFVAYASDEARAVCKDRDIRLTVLEHQVLPAEISVRAAKGVSKKRAMRDVVKELLPVIGVMPFAYIYATAGRTLKSSLAAQAIIQKIRADERRATPR